MESISMSKHLYNDIISLNGSDWKKINFLYALVLIMACIKKSGVTQTLRMACALLIFCASHAAVAQF